MPVALTQESKYVGNDRWEWSVRLDGPAEELDSIDRVTYVLHPTLPPSGPRSHGPEHEVPPRHVRLGARFTLRARVQCHRDGTRAAITARSLCSLTALRTERRRPLEAASCRGAHHLAGSCEVVPNDAGISKPRRCFRASAGGRLACRRRTSRPCRRTSADGRPGTRCCRGAAAPRTGGPSSTSHVSIFGSSGADRVDEVLVVRSTRSSSGRSARVVRVGVSAPGPFSFLGPRYDCHLLAGFLDPQPALSCRRTGCRSSRCPRRW